jgi:hypothetical protein
MVVVVCFIEVVQKMASLALAAVRLLSAGVVMVIIMARLQLLLVMVEVVVEAGWAVMQQMVLMEFV